MNLPLRPCLGPAPAPRRRLRLSPRGPRSPTPPLRGARHPPSPGARESRSRQAPSAAASAAPSRHAGRGRADACVSSSGDSRFGRHHRPFPWAVPKSGTHPPSVAEGPCHSPRRSCPGAWSPLAPSHAPGKEPAAETLPAAAPSTSREGEVALPARRPGARTAEPAPEVTDRQGRRFPRGARSGKGRLAREASLAPPGPATARASADRPSGGRSGRPLPDASCPSASERQEGPVGPPSKGHCCCAAAQRWISSS